MPSRGLLTAFLLLTSSGCSPEGDSSLTVPMGGCQATAYGTAQWTIGGFYRQEQLVDPAAVPLVGKVRVGEEVSLWITVKGSFCGVPPSAEWTSTDPQVAVVSGDGNFGELTGVSQGRTVVYAMKHGSRADLYYYCCGSCESPAPPPRCQDVPIESVQVVP